MTGVGAAGVCSMVLLFSCSALVKAMDQTAEEDSLVKKLTAVCGKDGIKVSVRFSQPFRGIVYSDGHYDTPHCVFIDQEKRANVNSVPESRFSFLIPADECGTKFHDPGSTLSSRKDNASVQPVNELANEVYMENTVMFQQSHFIQEQGDLAQTLRCVWQKEIRRPLQATLPLSIRGKHRPKYVAEGKEEKKEYAALALSTSTMFPPPGFLPRNYTKSYGYLTSSQQRHADIMRRFQPKGQVESVIYGNSRRSGKSLNLHTPAPAKQLKSDQDLILYRNPSNFTALPFKAVDTSGGVTRAKLPLLFSLVSLSPKTLVALGVFLTFHYVSLLQVGALQY